MQSARGMYNNVLNDSRCQLHTYTCEWLKPFIRHHSIPYRWIGYLCKCYMLFPAYEVTWHQEMAVSGSLHNSKNKESFSVIMWYNSGLTVLDLKVVITNNHTGGAAGIWETATDDCLKFKVVKWCLGFQQLPTTLCADIEWFTVQSLADIMLLIKYLNITENNRRPSIVGYLHFIQHAPTYCAMDKQHWRCSVIDSWCTADRTMQGFTASNIVGRLSQNAHISLLQCTGIEQNMLHGTGFIVILVLLESMHFLLRYVPHFRPQWPRPLTFWSPIYTASYSSRGNLSESKQCTVVCCWVHRGMGQTDGQTDREIVGL